MNLPETTPEKRKALIKDKPKRRSVREKVQPALDVLGINTEIEPHIERLTEEFMKPQPARRELAYDSYGYPVSITLPGCPAKPREEALISAKQVAPAELRRTVRDELEGKRINPRTARIVGSVIGGSRVKDIASNHGISTQCVYQIIGRFIEEISSSQITTNTGINCPTATRKTTFANR